MALTPQTKNIPLYGGIDTRTDPKYVAPGMCLQANNVRYTAVNAVDQRYGQTKLTQNIGLGASTITVGKSLGALNQELLLFNGNNLYSYAQGQQAWFNRTTLTEVTVNAQTVIQTAGTVNGISTARAGALEIYAWEDSRGGAYYAIRDATSASFALVPTLLDGVGVNPQIIVAGTSVYIFYGSTGTGLKAAFLSTNNPAAGIMNTYLLSFDYGGGPFGVCVSGSFIYGAWISTTSGNWNARIWDTSLNLQATVSGQALPTAGTVSASLVPTTDGSSVGLFWVTNGTAINLAGMNTSTAALTGITPIATTGAKHVVGVGVSATNIQLYYDQSYSSTMPTIIVGTVVMSGATISSTVGGTPFVGLALASQPVVNNGSVYLVGMSPTTNLAGTTSQQTSFYLFQGNIASAPQLTILQRFLGNSAAQGIYSIPQLQVSGTQLFVGLCKKTALRVDSTGTIFAQAGAVACYFSFPTVSQVHITPFNNLALINCANTYSYDGALTVENGFWEFPDGITAAASGVGSGLSAGLYDYQVTFEWIDAVGNVTYSAASYTVSITVTAGQFVTLTVPYTALTLRTDATVNIYRSAHNTSSPLYKIYSTGNVTSGVTSFTYVDGAADTAIQGQQFLYAPSDATGEIDNDPAPPFSFMVATKTRVFGIAQDDPTALWYSKPMAPGRPVDFSADQVIRIETDGGAVTAMAALDTQCIVFKANRIYYLPGDGPNAAGLGSQFPLLQRISSTSGCTNAASVLSTSDGIWFQSGIGLQVLGRGFVPDPKPGLPVQTLVNTLTLSGVQVVSPQNQLRWTTQEGTALVYDYVLNRWSTYDNYAGVSYVSWNNTVARLTSTGQVWYEDTTTYLDGTSAVQMLVETAHLKLVDMAQGYAAIWYAEILGQYYNSHNLVIEVEYDYQGAAPQISTWTPANTNNFTTFGSGATFGSEAVFGGPKLVTTPYQLRIATQRQVCQTVKFKIYTTNQTGRSCTLNEIALQLGVVGGLNRVPTSQQV